MMDEQCKKKGKNTFWLITFVAHFSKQIYMVKQRMGSLIRALPKILSREGIVAMWKGIVESTAWRGINFRLNDRKLP
jgi:hypothetical protein